ncbi:hypothetical protein E3N88_08993 [Mikania micrantha]|uniref:Uncharacterized protein n=1 Tax=Mikania micrantha TaxID=192012 RepID=A0A5N6PIS3_9ASTR|nr:hypothetical protein E3N88_08993 [Mikania micrantha]
MIQASDAMLNAWVGQFIVEPQPEPEPQFEPEDLDEEDFDEDPDEDPDEEDDDGPADKSCLNEDPMPANSNAGRKGKDRHDG